MLDEHPVHSCVNARYGRTAIIPLFAFIRLLHDHGRVGLKQQHVALLIEAEVDARLVQPEGPLQMFERGHRLGTQNEGHVF